MTSLVFSAPDNTPYSYPNEGRPDKDGNPTVVKAGKIYFAEDVYIWLIPFSEDGSNYKTQTVYYKGKDIILYKVANAGDVFYFNAEVDNGDGLNSGFVLSKYFLDVVYSEIDHSNNEWYDIWGNIQTAIFDVYQNYNQKDYEYVKEDFSWIGNVYSSSTGRFPVIDAFTVVWDS